MLGEKGNIIVLLGGVWMLSIVLHNIFLSTFTNYLTIICTFIFIFFMFKNVILEEWREDKNKRDEIENNKEQ